MNTIQLKSEFHKLIDTIEDNHILEEFYEILNGYKNQKKEIDIIDELTSIQQKRLKESIEQSKQWHTLSDNEMKKEITK